MVSIDFDNGQIDSFLDMLVFIENRIGAADVIPDNVKMAYYIILDEFAESFGNV
jgi:hypothetical protein